MERLRRIPEKHWIETRIRLKNRLNAVIHNSIPPKDTETTASKTYYPAHSGFINDEAGAFLQGKY